MRTHTVYGLVETRQTSPYVGQIRYVGMTSGLENRVKAYRKGQGNNFHHTNWLKACPDFDVVTLARVGTRDEAARLEIFWIAKLRTEQKFGEGGLNAHIGGGGLPPGPRYEWRGRTRPPEHCAAISVAKTGKPSPLTPAQRLELGQKLSQIPHTPEWNAKVSRGLKNNPAVIDQIRAMSKNKTSEHVENIRKSASARRWKCDECGLTGNAGSIGNHQRGTKHVGRSRNTCD